MSKVTWGNCGFWDKSFARAH
ncbi:hypothetical protein LINPERHAP1_LOCUS20305 [Linum perenne]